MTSSLVDLGKIIDPGLLDRYILVASELPEFVHKYGKNFSIPVYPCWMSYSNEGGMTGSISFTRNTFKHPDLKEMSFYIIDILKKLFVTGFVLDPARIHILKTSGDITIHRDEAGRKCCLNIGVKNTSGALTHTSVNQTRETFKDNHTTDQLLDGYGYLLNTYEYHSVESVNSEPRFLITYGFGADFNVIKNNLIKYNGKN